MEPILALAVNLAVLLASIALIPLLAWALEGRLKFRGGVASAFMDGFASVFETRQSRLQDAKREKQKGDRSSGDPPEAG